MKIKNILFIILILLLLFFTFTFSIGEYIRQETILQPFDNVDTSNTSFSLTTTPSRIEHMEPALKSLLIQKPKTIYLNIPYVFKKTGEKYKIPEWLDKYSDKVTILRPEDRGPATKFLGLLEHNIDPDEYICIVDDDIIYNKNMLVNLIKKADQFDGKHVITSGTLLAPPRVLGVYGVLFKRKTINNLINYKTTKECYLVDDIWFTSFLLENNIPITRLFKYYVANITSSTDSNNVFEFFKRLLYIHDPSINQDTALLKKKRNDG